MTWPASPRDLVAEQRRLAAARPQPYVFRSGATIGGCFVCCERGGGGAGHAGDTGWAAAAVLRGREMIGCAVSGGTAPASYARGLLALREGPLLEAAVRALPSLPEVLLVNATGQDHPRGAGLALHLGAVLDIPTVGVTDRVLVAAGGDPSPDHGAAVALHRDDDLIVGYRLRTRTGARPVAVTAAWRTDPETAIEVVRAASFRVRTPEPIRIARRLAREARARGPSGVLAGEDAV